LGRFRLHGSAGGLPSGGDAEAQRAARFKIAHPAERALQRRKQREAHILQEATAQQMHSTAYAPDSRLLGTMYGFFDFSDNGQRTIGNIGYSPGMNSLLLLLPDQNLGIFAVYNSDGVGEVTNQHLGFQRAFFDHYYSAPAVAAVQPPANFASRAARFVGSYGSAQGSHTTLEKIAGLFGAVEVRDSGDGALLFTAPYGEWRFVEVDGLYFRQADGPFGLVFSEDGQGRITYMSTDLIPQFAFEKLNWYQIPRFSMALALGCLVIFLSMILVAVIRAIRNRRPRAERIRAARGAGAAQLIIVGISILNLLFVVGTMQWGMPISVLHPISLVTRIVLGLGVLSAVLSLGALVYTVVAWNKRYWGVAARAYYTLVTAAAVAFVWFLNYWNLLGWRF
jgi:hypothetical protein